MSDDGGASGLRPSGLLPLDRRRDRIDHGRRDTSRNEAGGAYSFEHAHGLGGAWACTRTHVASVSCTRTSMLPITSDSKRRQRGRTEVTPSNRGLLYMSTVSIVTVVDVRRRVRPMALVPDDRTRVRSRTRPREQLASETPLIQLIVGVCGSVPGGFRRGSVAQV